MSYRTADHHHELSVRLPLRPPTWALWSAGVLSFLLAAHVFALGVPSLLLRIIWAVCYLLLLVTVMSWHRQAKLIQQSLLPINVGSTEDRDSLESDEDKAARRAERKLWAISIVGVLGYVVAYALLLPFMGPRPPL